MDFRVNFSDTQNSSCESENMRKSSVCNNNVISQVAVPAIHEDQKRVYNNSHSQQSISKRKWISSKRFHRDINSLKKKVQGVGKVQEEGSFPNTRKVENQVEQLGTLVKDPLVQEVNNERSLEMKKLKEQTDQLLFSDFLEKRKSFREESFQSFSTNDSSAKGILENSPRKQKRVEIMETSSEIEVSEQQRMLEEENINRNQLPNRQARNVVKLLGALKAFCLNCLFPEK